MADVVKILFLASNPRDTDRLFLDQEIKAIRERIRSAPPSEQVQIEQEWAVSAEEIPAALMRHQPHVVHFSGHGGEDGSLLLMNAVSMASDLRSILTYEARPSGRGAVA